MCVVHSFILLLKIGDGHRISMGNMHLPIKNDNHHQVRWFLCRLKWLHIERLLSSAVAASGFPCPEHNFVTVGPNRSKLGVHVSMQCQATHLFQ